MDYEGIISNGIVIAYNTRFSSAENVYVQKSFSEFGTRLWNCLHPDWCKLTKRTFKRKIHKLLLILC